MTMADTTVFGDDEPEDAWHPDDPVDEQVAQLIRRAELLDRRNILIPRGNHVVTLQALAELVALARRRRLTDRDVVRADHLDEDIAHVRNRL